jgi:two-component system KDP operon response regulator KdpE
MATILLIDDEALHRKLVTDTLVHAGHEVLGADSGPAGLQLLGQQPPDLVLLDVLMPRMDGWKVCEEIRKVSDVPLIMLTALNSEAEISRGLEIGADDFITKPISPRHLAARVAALLRRAETAEPVAAKAGLWFDDGRLTIDEDAHRVTVDGAKVDLTPTEFRLLVALASSPGRARTYADLLGTVWGPEYIDDIDFLRVYVWRLRKKLESGIEHDGWIENERGFGYRFGDDNAPEPQETRAATPARAPVLVVEDDDLSARLMMDVLASIDVACERVTRGDEAVARACELLPALVVMDIGLPGLDGVQATRELRSDERTKGIPVVAVTAYADPPNEEAMRLAGCDAFLTKPLRLKEFSLLVQGLLPATGSEK